MSLGLYVHLPFCVHRCVYCDFNVRQLRQRKEMTGYLAVLLKELEFYGRLLLDRSVDTIYLGGGTPSLFSVEQIETLLMRIRTLFCVSRTAEISIEANPNTVTIDKLTGMRIAGVNRLSLGVQSFHAEHLKTLERIHSSEQAERSIEAAKLAGFTSLNIDLMFGMPNQTFAQFQSDVERAVAFQPPHLSVYQLTLSPENRLYHVLPPDDLTAQMYHWLVDYLPQCGYEHYEVSAFAKPGHVCRHNLKYWELHDFLGIGVGAYSRLSGRNQPWGCHLKNADDLEVYQHLIAEKGRATVEEEPLTYEAAQRDYLVAGLRLLRGIRWTDFERRFRKSLMISYGNQVSLLVDEGLLDSQPEMLKLKKRGLLFLNKVLVEFM